jgi:hypothetical protein
MRHQAAHRRLEIIVANHTAGNARGTGGNAVFVQNDNPAFNRFTSFL